MRHVLTKMSAPGWEKVFDSEKAASDELENWICKTCMYEAHRETKNLGMSDLLFTYCGAEFYYEKE